jgi:hypothetical protein
VTAGSRELVGQSKFIGYAPDQINATRNSGLFRWILVEADGAREPVTPASSGWVIAMVGLDAIGKPLDDLHVFRAQDYARPTCTPTGTPPMEILAGERSCYTLLAFIALKMELYRRSNPLGKVRKNLPIRDRLET